MPAASLPGEIPSSFFIFNCTLSIIHSDGARSATAAIIHPVYATAASSHACRKSAATLIPKKDRNTAN